MLNAKRTSWDLSPIMQDAGEENIKKELREVRGANADFIKKWKNRDDYLKKPAVLKEALDDLEKISRNYGSSGNPGFYFGLLSSLRQDDTNVKAKLNQIDEASTKIQNDTLFFSLNISKIPKEEQAKFLGALELAEYKHFLESAFESAKYILTEPEEKIMNLKSPMAHGYWEQMIETLLSKQERKVVIDGKEETKNFSEILKLTEETNKETREEAAKVFGEILARYSEVAEAEMNAVLANKKVNDELRGFSRPDSERHLEDNLTTETVDQLIKAVTEKFELSKKFYELKAKLFKVDKIRYFERAVSYGEQKMKYPYEKAIELVNKTFSGLDKKFSDILERFSEKGQIDVFPKKGKHDGAFCTDYLPIQPTYILLNHNDTLKDVTTIAHEAGHGINAELMKEKQNALNLGTPKSTAEVASTFFEDFVLNELLKKAGEEERLSILIEKLSGDVSTIFRQTAFYNFEMELHTEFRKKGYLSKEEIGAMFKKNMSSYMGEFVDTSEAGNWWIYVPHFRNFFYVYSYTSGLLISKALQAKVKENHEFIEKVKDFLSAGTSDSPENIFKKMGVNIADKEFWNQGLNEFESLLNQTEELAVKLGKI